MFQAILTLLQSDMTGRGSLGKGSSEIESEKILSCLMFQFFKNWKRNLDHRSPDDLGEIQILEKSVFSSCICPQNKTGLAGTT